MAKAYIKLYYDFIEVTEPLTDAERGRLLIALLEYARSGEVPEGALAGNERFLFPAMRRMIDWESEAYDARARQNARNGAKGGRPRKNPDNPKNPMGFPETEKSQEQEKEQEKEQEQEQEHDQEQEKEKEHEQDQERECVGARVSAPRAPAPNEVTDFCRENRLRTDPQTFWNYYQAIGWRAGGRPIRDWQAKLREWEARESGGRPRRFESPRAAPNPALNYAQRDYADDDHYYIDLDAYADPPAG